MPIDEIGFVVGYENTAFFRRLFQRTTRLHPGSYHMWSGKRHTAVSCGTSTARNANGAAQ
jgi:transcriptional regulator GlxA family with amidase domain